MSPMHGTEHAAMCPTVPERLHVKCRVPPPKPLLIGRLQPGEVSARPSPVALDGPPKRAHRCPRHGHGIKGLVGQGAAAPQLPHAVEEGEAQVGPEELQRGGLGLPCSVVIGQENLRVSRRGRLATDSCKQAANPGHRWCHGWACQESMSQGLKLL